MWWAQKHLWWVGMVSGMPWCGWDIIPCVTHPALCTPAGQLCHVLLTALLLNQTLSFDSRTAARTPTSVFMSSERRQALWSRVKPPVPTLALSSSMAQQQQQQQQPDAQPGGAGDNISEVKYNRKKLANVLSKQQRVSNVIGPAVSRGQGLKVA